MPKPESEAYKANGNQYKQAIECRNPTVGKLDNRFDRRSNGQHFAIAERPVTSTAIT
jgi:hypothetical protein